MAAVNVSLVTGPRDQAAGAHQLILRSRNAERRKSALDDLEALSKVAQELSHLLLLRDLRSTVERTS